MSTFLKIVGFILLGLLIFALLLVLSALFSPIHYTVYATGKEIDYNVKASWLFRIVRFSAPYKKPISLKIFWVDILEKRNKKTKDNTKSDKKEMVEKKELEESKDAEKPEEFEKPIKDKKDIKQQKNKKRKDKPKKGFKDFIAQLKEWQIKILVEETLKLIKILFVAIGIKEFSLKGEIGFENPAITGQVIGVYAAVFGMLGLPMKVKGNFEKEIIHVDVDIIGKTTLWKIGKPLVEYIRKEPMKTIFFKK